MSARTTDGLDAAERLHANPVPGDGTRGIFKDAAHEVLPLWYSAAAVAVPEIPSTPSGWLLADQNNQRLQKANNRFQLTP